MDDLKKRKRANRRLTILLNILFGFIAGYISMLGYSLTTIEFWILMGAMLIYGIAQREDGREFTKILAAEFDEEHGHVIKTMGQMADTMREMVGKISPRPPKSSMN